MHTSSQLEAYMVGFLVPWAYHGLVALWSSTLVPCAYQGLAILSSFIPAPWSCESGLGLGQSFAFGCHLGLKTGLVLLLCTAHELRMKWLCFLLFHMKCCYNCCCCYIIVVIISCSLLEGGRMCQEPTNSKGRGGWCCGALGAQRSRPRQVSCRWWLVDC